MFQIVEKEEQGSRIASLVGRMDAESVSDFSEWYSSRVESGSRSIILDLSGLKYLSSSGMRGILSAVRLAENHGSVLLLCGLCGMARQTFQVAGLLNVLPVFSDTEHALDSLS